MAPYDLPTSVTVAGTPYAIRSDFRAILDVMGVMADPDLEDGERAATALAIFYEDPDSIPLLDLREAVERLMWFVRGGTDEAKSGRRPRVMDWGQDFQLIAAPVNKVLGYECRTCEYLHWWSFLAAYLEIGPETLFGRVLRIREKLRTGKKLEKYERSFLKSHYNLVVLPQKFSRAEDQILKDWA